MLEMYLAQAVPPWDAETVPVIFIKGHESRVWLPGRQKMTEDRKNVTRSTLPSFWKTAKRVPAPPLITCHSPTTTRCCSWWNMPSGSTTNRDTHSVSIFWTHLTSHGNRWIHILSCFPHRIPVWTTCLCLPLERFNVTEYVLRQLPDTKWKPYLVTNVRFLLYHLNDPLGYTRIKLPCYIKNFKSIVSLDRSRKSMIYEDHLCAFQCFAVHQGHLNDQLGTHTKALYDRWVEFAKDRNLDVYNKPADFPGLPLLFCTFWFFFHYKKCALNNLDSGILSQK